MQNYFTDSHVRGFYLFIKCIFSRWVPLSRWDQTRHTTTSSWTSLDLAVHHLSLETWVQEWMRPIWVVPQWEWTNLGAKAWGLLGPTAKECLSRATQDLGLRPWVCRAWKDHIQGRWVDESTLAGIPSSFSRCRIYVVIHSQLMVGTSMDQTTSSPASRGSTPHPMPPGRCRPPTTPLRGCQDNSSKGSTHRTGVLWASTIRCSEKEFH